MKETDSRLVIWLSIVTGAVVVLIIGVIIGIAALASDVAQSPKQTGMVLDEQVTALKFGGRPDGGSTTQPSASSALKSTPVSGSTPSAFKAQIDGLNVTTSGLVISLTVQFSGPADLLYQPPIVRGAKSASYTIMPDSLKAARFAFLDLTTRGQATAQFVFQPAPAAKESLTLVFNPTMPAGDAVAPRIEVVLRGGE